MITTTIRGVVRSAIAQKTMRIAAFNSTPANINKKGEEVQDPITLEQTYVPSKAKLENNTAHNEYRGNSHDEVMAQIGEQGSQLPKLPKTSLSPEAIENMKNFLGMGKNDNGRG